jgi:hypothetical protein
LELKKKLNYESRNLKNYASLNSLNIIRKNKNNYYFITKDELMSAEEIKQNAEEYANSMYDKKYQNELWKECYMIYIAGAHSRDEEIKVLKEEIKILRDMLGDIHRAHFRL